jgi:hypothetical protein
VSDEISGAENYCRSPGLQSDPRQDQYSPFQLRAGPYSLRTRSGTAYETLDPPHLRARSIYDHIGGGQQQSVVAHEKGARAEQRFFVLADAELCPGAETLKCFNESLR